MTAGDRMFHSTIYFILFGAMFKATFPMLDIGQLAAVTVVLSFMFTRLEELRQATKKENQL